MLAPPDSELPVAIEAVADKTTLASITTATVAEPRLLGTPEDATWGIVIRPDSCFTSSPKGDSEMKVGMALSLSEYVAGRVEAL